jgi:hypothetical protein
MSADTQKLKALQMTLDRMDKTFGKGAVMKLGDEAVEPIESIPSGSLTLDLALGIQGYPKGRVVEIYGPEALEKRHWPFMPLRSHKNKAAYVPSLTLSMPLISFTLRTLGSIQRTF